MKRWKKLSVEQLVGAHYALRIARSWTGFRGQALALLDELLVEVATECNGRPAADAVLPARKRRARA